MKLSFQTNNNTQFAKELEEAADCELVNVEINRAEQTSSHLFQPGDRVELYGLTGYPQFNGKVVEISSIRRDGRYGRAYYIKPTGGPLDREMNWVYECRLRRSGE